MKPALVLDASVALCWLFPAQHGESATDLLGMLRDDQNAVVPSVFNLVLVHVACKAERKGLTSAAMLDRFFALIEELRIGIDREAMEQAMAFGRILSLSRTHGLTSYDACYLELAMRHRVPLATFDNRLREAADAVGLPVLGEMVA